MQIADLFLRLGCSMVGWMVLYAHIIWLAALRAMSCGPDGDEMHRLLLGLIPFTVGFAFALRLTRPLPDIHKILRWLGVPLVLLLPFALRSIWDTFRQVNLESQAICGTAAATGWQPWWAAVQFVTVLLVATMVLRMWRGARPDTSNGINSHIR